ncbi:peroxisomal leader peptide-processing protease [Prorops nasuta]|uniref:peroxisomal leader peptide-processing protease n=1 Tax=Prorops nasuta TaxID=863751 RepID=UPI0034CE71FE
MREMIWSRSVLITHPFSRIKSSSGSYCGSSGILLSENWVLTHGSTLNPVVGQINQIFDFLTSMDAGKLTLLPTQVVEETPFEILRECSACSDATREQSSQLYLVAAWKCDLLQLTLLDVLATWTFDRSSRHSRDLMPILLIFEIKNHLKNATATKEHQQQEKTIRIHRVLTNLYKEIAENDPVRGSIVEIEGTPFGNRIFFNSTSRGIIGNLIGTRKCIVMTDASAFPGCQGGPLYILRDSDNNRKILCGMVLSSVSWCENEWVDYTLAVNLTSSLREILLKEDFSITAVARETQLLQIASYTDQFDESVAIVRCGRHWGTGIFLDKATGSFLTCSHVVKEASLENMDVRVVLRRGECRSDAWAKLVYKTPEGRPYDVALLRVQPQDLAPSLRPIKLADNPPFKGEAVLSVGFPLISSTNATLTSGNVSKSLAAMLQTTCCVQSGASGSPIIRPTTGQMLGMIISNAISANSILYPRLSMAIPTTVLKPILQRYWNTGDPRVLEAFDCHDSAIQDVWDLRERLPPSKI